MKRNRKDRRASWSHKRTHLLAIILSCWTNGAVDVIATDFSSRSRAPLRIGQAPERPTTTSADPQNQRTRRLPSISGATPTSVDAKSSESGHSHHRQESERRLAPISPATMMPASGLVGSTPQKTQIRIADSIPALPRPTVRTNSFVDGEETLAADETRSRSKTNVHSSKLNVLPASARRPSTVNSDVAMPHEPIANRWLQSITTDTCSKRAKALLDDAYREYSVAAWASAEDSAWQALELIAQGIDVADRRTSASTTRPTAARDLAVAREAITEARDFISVGSAMDLDRMKALVASHHTPVLLEGLPPGITSSEAADRYLDYARVKLAALAAYRAQAAQAMDLIAAIGLGRNDARKLPAETALCLRRAALQGQPQNASLATRLGMQLSDMGLDDEASWTLRHAMSLKPTRQLADEIQQVLAKQEDRNAALQMTASLRQQMPQSERAERIPEVIELSPTQFASISPAMNLGTGTPVTGRGSVTTNHLRGNQAQTQPSRIVNAQTVATPTGPAQNMRRFIPTSLAGFKIPSLRKPKREQRPTASPKPSPAKSSETSLSPVITVQSAAHRVPEIVPDASANPRSSSTIKKLKDRVSRFW